MSQVSRKISNEITENQYPRVRRTSGRGEAGPKGKVEQERMQVFLNEYLCRCLRLWQVQWRRVISG